MNTNPSTRPRACSSSNSPTLPGASIASRSSKPNCSLKTTAQFEKTLRQLRAIQYHRREGELRDLKDAAAILEHHKHKGIPWEPSDNGFVFSKDQVERASQRMLRLNESRHIEYCRFGSFANAMNAF
jgi:hypothetical protein